MMRSILNTIAFAALSFALTLAVGALCVGIDCAKHGDIGPYPLCDWADRWLLPSAMLAAFVILEARNTKAAT